MIPQAELEKITTEAYKEFHKQNQELFQKDRIEYWRLATQYKERVLREYKYKRCKDE